MYRLVVGVGRVSLLMRYARSLKDKRNTTKSLVQKLRNQGFSVSECGDPEDMKQSTIGYSYTGSSAAMVEKALEDASRVFQGDFEILGIDSEVFDYSTEVSDKINDLEDWKYGG